MTSSAPKGTLSKDSADSRLRPEEFSAAVAAVTSAFGDPTRRQVYLFAHEHDEGVTAARVASRFDLHPNVARHHLDKLAAGGHLEVHVVRDQASGAGRPAKHYRVTGKEFALEFPQRRDDLILQLLGRALGELDQEQAERVATEVGVAYGRDLAAHMAPGEAHRSLRAALHAVADALTAHGFAAHAEARGGSLQIVADHCPFGTTALDNPVMCAVDRGMAQGMLEGLYGDVVPATSQSRAHGDSTCVTDVAVG